MLAAASILLSNKVGHIPDRHTVVKTGTHTTVHCTV